MPTVGEMTWSVGDRVRHSSLSDWGLGEVVELLGDGKIRVYFASGGERVLKDAPLTRAVGADATLPLPRPRTRAGIPSRSQLKHRSIEAYRDAFVEQFPKGFADSGYIQQEREYKLRAANLLEASLSLPLLQVLVDEGSWDEIAKRARTVISKTNLIFRNEAMDIHDGLRSATAKERFGRTLFALLYGGGEFPDRFEEFCGLLEEIGAPKWPVATYFPYLAHPSTHILLKPTPTNRIAAACGIELNYRTNPNALTYASLLRLSERLKDILHDLGPRDMIDVQSFIWCVAR